MVYCVKLFDEMFLKYYKLLINEVTDGLLMISIKASPKFLYLLFKFPTIFLTIHLKVIL